ncbi:exopolyphosphatase PRUNE1 [Scaptodrosophila lebanonensis]|uniref:Exopolyphosphatase PRUNE1 n=1 Tax=Drosophila lebanonensis TaxID=7225 RepID=A0A6J2TRY2_DROLE|nr:exopolyphosphatase PRUNE1 [Scaptodrosophila lebanonensis]
MFFERFLIQARGALRRYLPDPVCKSVTKLPDPIEKVMCATNKLHIVIGNESCDLDSAVSAITLAYIYAMRNKEYDYVPVLNISRGDYMLKTEVGYLFNMCNIPEDMLLFRDDLPQKLPCEVNVILVDHHVSPFASNVIEVLDHRPLDDSPTAKPMRSGCVRQIEPEIGSCATLVTERYFADSNPRSTTIEKLLRSTIILDTINFSQDAKRYCERDKQMVRQLEQSLYGQVIENIEMLRLQVFNQLTAARSDVSMLTLTEVLRKDMKVLKTASHEVIMAGMPLLVYDYVQKIGAADAIREVGGSMKLFILLGMHVHPQSGKVNRDIGIISLSGHKPLLERVKRALMRERSPDLNLKPHVKELDFMGGIFLEQHNIQATRKHILPVIKRMLLRVEEEQSNDVYFFKSRFTDVD